MIFNRVHGAPTCAPYHSPGYAAAKWYTKIVNEISAISDFLYVTVYRSSFSQREMHGNIFAGYLAETFLKWAPSLKLLVTRSTTFLKIKVVYGTKMVAKH